MAKAPATTPEETYGPLEPEDGDTVITSADSPESIMSQVMIACDSNTGVFFFRYQRRLYMRVVEFE